MAVPLTPPVSLVNRLSLRAFNALYYRQRERRGLTHYAPFCCPLDGIGHWNRVCGPKGSLRWHGVFPPAAAESALREILGQIAGNGQESFLAVLKIFGARPSPGWMSFQRPGVTLALDFPLTRAILPVLERLDAIVAAGGGALYPAKDARMAPAMFRRSFPRADRILPFLAPAFLSGFWRRVSI